MTILYFVLAAAALGILVFIHELGHYYVARKVGMTVEVFSIGFGRAVLKWKVNGVAWQLGWLPFGGYVKIAGMEVTKQKDKKTYIEPHEIPGGFFANAPWKRIAVALAGPVANLILAFFIFAAMFAMGGREKFFSEFTKIIGWVDPGSELYVQGVRPGDILTHYDGKPYTSSKDLLYAAMLSDRNVKLQGYHVDYATGKKSPFSYTIETYQSPASPDGILTTGISNVSRYFIYDKLPGSTPFILPGGSPMEGSGLQYGDRVVWADGQLLFSMDQLSYILNDGRALLTVKRGDSHFITRQPRVKADDLILPGAVKNELSDWQYAAGIEGRWQELKVMPYNLSPTGVVTNSLEFIDNESRDRAFPRNPLSPELEQPLEIGDQIVAIDGTAITTSYQLLDLLQTRQVQLMVDRQTPVDSKVLWKDEDALFQKAVHWDEIQTIAQSIGTPNPVKESEYLTLLAPVIPKRLDQFDFSPEMSERIKSEFELKKEQIGEIKDSERRAQALHYLEESQNKLTLGVVFQDEEVTFNPNPFALFGSIFTETWHTLKALILGYLHPKWISGPIGIVNVIHHGWSLGIGEALFWIGAISLNLGVFNLLPIPVLDGGYICISLWEMITRRRLKAKTIERLIIPFVVLLVAFLIFLTIQDISRLF